MQRPQCHFDFPHSYNVQVLESYSLAHPLEKLHHFPVRLEEGDRTGVYARVTPATGPAWIGFFALGFDSGGVAHGICSLPAPDFLCVSAGGYSYVVNTANPEDWEQVEQRPVVSIVTAPEQRLLLFAGFTSITAYGEAGQLWTSERLSWEGISISRIEGGILYGTGWDALKDQNAEFEIDLRTGTSKGGARPR